MNQHWVITKQDLVVKLSRQVPTPFYLVDQQTLASNIASWLQPAEASGRVQVHYAVKANDNNRLLQIIHAAGCHFDIVSIGELFRLKHAGVSANKVIFSGPGKTLDDLRAAVVEKVKSIHIESLEELYDLQSICMESQFKDSRINVALRINPNIIAGGHQHIFTGGDEHKFGIAKDAIKEACEVISNCDNLHLIGLSIHLGSQIDSIDPYESVLLYLIDVLQSSSGMETLQYLDLGGGVGIDDFGKVMITPATLITRCEKILQEKSVNLKLYFEPGRAIIANAAALITKVTRCKSSINHHFVICDAGMNDYIRVALYDAVPTMLNVSQLPPVNQPVDWIQTSATNNLGKIVGPVCESGDTFMQMNLPLNKFQADDILALINAGAYSQVMSSQYNSRPFIANYLICAPDDSIRLIKRRGDFMDLIYYEADEQLDLSEATL